MSRAFSYWEIFSHGDELRAECLRTASALTRTTDAAILDTLLFFSITSISLRRITDAVVEVIMNAHAGAQRGFEKLPARQFSTLKLDILELLLDDAIDAFRLFTNDPQLPEGFHPGPLLRTIDS